MSCRILITGAAGFIGSQLAFRLLKDKRVDKVIGVDNLCGVLDLKIARLNSINKTHSKKWQFVFGDITDENFVKIIFDQFKPRVVVNLAAQAGVPFSILYPEKTFAPNVTGFFNILNACAKANVKHFIYASSSTVYGNDAPNCNFPLSFYAASKRADEIFAYSFSQTYKIYTTGLRFFSVYGQWGRPDMLYFKAANNFLRNEPIFLYAHGKISRDFTFVNDVVECISRVIFKPPRSLFNLYDVGNSKPVPIYEFILKLISVLITSNVLLRDFNHYKNLIAFKPATSTDIFSTRADIMPFKRDFLFAPKTDISAGLRKFANWFKFFVGVD